MRKSTIALTFGTAGLLMGLLLFTSLSAAEVSYGEERAQIEAVQGHRQPCVVACRI